MHGHNGGRPDRGIRRRCQDLVSRLEVDDPFDMPTFLDGVAATIGRPITLSPTRAQLAGICGALIVTDRQIYIFYPAGTSTIHQQHVVFHEIGHLLCPDHHDPAHSIASLAPNLSPELIERVLGRSTYTSRQEQEAELVATLIAGRARRTRCRPSRPVTTGPVRTIFDVSEPPDSAPEGR